MKPWQKRTLTHAGGIAVGLMIAAALKPAAVPDEAAPGTDHAAPPAAGAAASAPMRPGRPIATKAGDTRLTAATVRAGDFKGAWDAIAGRDLTISQRLEMQIGVLREWAMVDMEGAMLAALGNAWDGGKEKGGIGPLMVAFDDAFQARPLEVWDLLQSGKLGLGTEVFRQQWITSACRTEPVFVFSMAREIPVALRMGAIQSAMRAVAGKPELEDQMRRKMAELPDEPGYDNYIALAFNALPADAGNAAEVRGRLAAATNDRAKTMLLHEFASTLREAGGTTLMAEWEKLDPEMRKRAAVAFFNGAQGATNAPVVLEMLMATDQWDRVRSAYSRLEEYGKNTRDPQALATWGLSLPDNPESEALFRKTIDPLINRDNNGARDWIDAIPANDPRREKALFAYTQNALYARNDEALFQWALERISDPDTKAAAQRSYDGWLRRRGLGGN